MSKLLPSNWIRPRSAKSASASSTLSSDSTPQRTRARFGTTPLSPCVHRLLKGHRLRLQLSGGAHPQYARNLGTGEPLATGIGMKTAVYTIYHRNTRLRLPVISTAITSAPHMGSPARKDNDESGDGYAAFVIIIDRYHRRCPHGQPQPQPPRSPSKPP
jgi:hypothetical protein